MYTFSMDKIQQLGERFRSLKYHPTGKKDAKWVATARGLVTVIDGRKMAQKDIRASGSTPEEALETLVSNI